MGNTPSSVPYGAQIVALDTALSCSTNDGATYDNYNFTLSATTALSGGAGTQIYYSDITVKVDLPPQYAQFGAQNSGNWNASVAFYLDAINASPSNIIVQESVVFPTTDSSFTTPGNGGVGAPIGPFTLGSANQIHRSSLGFAYISLQYLQGGNTFEAFCQKHPPEIILASVAITNSTTGPSVQAPANNAPGKFPPTVPGQKAAIAHFPVYCSKDPLDDFSELNFTFGGVSPNSLTAGSQFNLNQVQYFVTIPADIVGYLDGFYQGDATVIGLNLDQDLDGNTQPGQGLAVNLVNTSPDNIDLSKNVVATVGNPRLPLSASQSVEQNAKVPVTLAYPQYGSLISTTFTAGASGSVAALNYSSLKGTLYGQTNGQTSGMINVYCVPQQANELFAAPIS